MQGTNYSLDLGLFLLTVQRGNRTIKLNLIQGFGSVFIFYGSGSGSRGRGWRSIWIRIQSGSRALMTKNLKQITAEKKLNFFLIKNCNLPIPRPLWSMSKLQKKPASHKRGHPTLQNMNFFYFCGSFLPSWIRIRIPNTDPDPLARLNTDPIRIRIRNPDLIIINYYLKYEEHWCHASS